MTETAPSSDRDIADRLHSAAIHLLRGLRRVDRMSGLSAARLSALSVLVFAGPCSVTGLAAAEQVAPPTMSRLLKDMAGDGLIKRARSGSDARLRIFSATALGRRILEKARARRVEALLAEIRKLSAGKRETLVNSLEVIEGLAAGAQGANSA